MKYPLEKYHFYEHATGDGGIETIAVSTYCGKVVKGRAKCHPEDEYNVEVAKNLSAMRCNVKIAEKRFNRSAEAVAAAKEAVNAAVAHLNDMMEYFADSNVAFENAQVELENYLNVIKHN